MCHRTFFPFMVLMLFLFISCDNDNPTDPSDPTNNIPLSPTNLHILDRTGDFIQIEWQDNSDNENFFHIEKSTIIAGSFEPINTLGANSYSYLDTAVIHGNRYYYRVRASNDKGYSEYSNEVQALANAVPDSFVLINQEYPSRMSFYVLDRDLIWGEHGYYGDNYYFRIYLDSYNPPSTLIYQTYYPGGERYYFDSWEHDIDLVLLPNTTYYWKAIATDTAGDSLEGPIWSFTTIQ